MKSYFWTSIIYLGCILLLFIFLNIIVDPYHVFRVVEINNFNENKIFQSNKEQIFKPISVYKNQPQIILLGSSKLQMGLNPRTVEKVTGQSTYNMGIDGPTIYELLHFQRFVINNTQAKTIVLGLDLLMFNGKREKYNSRFNLLRMQSVLDKSKKYLLSPTEFVANTLTVQSVINSVKTVLYQDLVPYYDDLGFVGHNIKRKAVYNNTKIMIHKFESSASAYSRMHRDFSNKFQDSTSTYHYFREIIRDAFSSNITLIVFISPNHKFFENIMMRENLLTQYSTWKAQIRRIIAEEASSTKKQQFTLFDFSIDKRNQEIVPEKGYMYYWEDAYHFSPNYGDEIIQTMFTERLEHF